MKNIAQNLKKFTKPSKDFMVIDDLKAQPKYFQCVYQKIFAEFIKFFEGTKRYILLKSSLDGNACFKIKTKKQEYKVELQFDKEVVGLYINDLFIEDSNIFGANIDKEIEVATDIKIDLVSLKNKIRELVV